MKILYAIQGTGNGHLTRARDIVPLLKKKAETDLLVSGTQADIQLPYPVKYRLKGMSFIFGKKGGVDIWRTYKKTDSRRLWKEIRTLPVQDYDLVINDFEPVSAWAARLRGIPCVALSHQAAVLHPKAPHPEKKDWFGRQILRHYAPVKHTYGFHFEPYDGHIFTPVIRKEIRDRVPVDKGHYTVYLPAYGHEKLVRKFSSFPGITWEVFSKHARQAYRQQNVWIKPVSNHAFISSMANSTGVLCGAGFETPAEALYLGKKLLVIPMKTQYEQKCNAAALKQLGVPVLKNLKQKRLHKLGEWLESDERVTVQYPNQTEAILDKILEKHLFTPVEATHRLANAWR